MSDTPTEADADTGATDTATTESPYEGYDAGTMRWLSGIVSLVGLLLAVAPFLWADTEMALWNNVAVGLAVFLLAGYNYYRMSKGFIGSISVATLVALLGLWSVVAPFVYPFDAETLAWVTIGAGVVVALVSGYNAYESRQATARTTPETRA